jgi:hypothetical protein
MAAANEKRRVIMLPLWPVRKNSKQSVATTDKRCFSNRLSGELDNLAWTDVERFLRNPQVVLDQLSAGMKQTSNNEPFAQRLFH